MQNNFDFCILIFDFIVSYTVSLANKPSLSYTNFMALKNQSSLMKKLLSQNKEIPRLPKKEDLVEGQVIEMGKNALILDLGALGTGIVYGAELKDNKELVKEIKIGDTISAVVLEPENEDGYVELSLKEGQLAKAWAELKKKKEAQEILTAKVTKANQGGLIVKLNDLVGFLPASQLSAKNYPRVENGDKNKILSHLNKFVNKEIKVKIITLDQKQDKLIVSERTIIN